MVSTILYRYKHFPIFPLQRYTSEKVAHARVHNQWCVYIVIKPCDACKTGFTLLIFE